MESAITITNNFGCPAYFKSFKPIKLRSNLCFICATFRRWGSTAQWLGQYNGGWDGIAQWMGWCSTVDGTV